MANGTEQPLSVRVDRYLWAVRLAGSRTLATELCRGGRVKVNGARVKPAHLIHLGDRIAMTQGVSRRDIEVTGLISTRVSAKVAADCLVDHSPTPPAKDTRAAPFARDPSAGRPTKRDRRQLDQLRRGN